MMSYKEWVERFAGQMLIALYFVGSILDDFSKIRFIIHEGE